MIRVCLSDNIALPLHKTPYSLVLSGVRLAAHVSALFAWCLARPALSHSCNLTPSEVRACCLSFLAACGPSRGRDTVESGRCTAFLQRLSRTFRSEAVCQARRRCSEYKHTHTLYRTEPITSHALDSSILVTPNQTLSSFALQAATTN